MDSQLLFAFVAAIVGLIACVAFDLLSQLHRCKALIDQVLKAPEAVDRVWLDQCGVMRRLNVKFKKAPLTSVPCLYRIEGVIETFQAADVAVLDLRHPETR